MEPRSVYDLVAHLHRQRAFSLRTFGPGRRTRGVCDHIRKEFREVVAAPQDLEEWTDLVLLSFDGALRSGGTPEAIAAALGGGALPDLDLAEHLRMQAPDGIGSAAERCGRIGVVLDRVEAEPEALAPWIAVIRLALGGALASGAAPERIAGAIDFKLGKNERRTWPDWRDADPDKAIEHVRTAAEAAAAAALGAKAPAAPGVAPMPEPARPSQSL